MLKLEELEKNILLAPHTTYKIGGPADLFYIANTTGDLMRAIQEAEESLLPYFVLGTGANILISDAGFRGLVILNRASSIRFENNLLIAESGATISDLIDASLEKNLSGLEHFAGIPSSVGGAIRQNLHFLSPDRKNTLFIESVVKEGVVWENGEKRRVEKDYFRFGYDDSVLYHNSAVVLEITFELLQRDKEQIRDQIQANLEWREERQPQLDEFPSCGSVFKKIEGIGAGRLIEQVGLKGKQIGRARISEKHANYIVNMGDATAKDVYELTSLIQKTVLEKTGHKLEPEIGFIGEF